MRIIAGLLKGRRIEAGKWPGLRPTSDTLRETLFNVLGARVANARVLDGYAGTGAIGLEALSRGAARVTFVERDRRAAAVIAANVARCGVESGCVIIRAGFAQSAGAALAGATFELVLLDPPYEERDLAAVVTAAAPLVAAGGWLVLEHARRRTPPERVAGLEPIRHVRSGDSALAIYERRNSRG
jgi:16S rRNA (guanine966-N2)-methyltransferase